MEREVKMSKLIYGLHGANYMQIDECPTCKRTYLDIQDCSDKYHTPLRSQTTVTTSNSSVIEKWPNDICKTCMRTYYTPEFDSLWNDLTGQLQSKINIAESALNKIIEMNRQQSKDQYGNAEKAENWACVEVCRKALREINDNSTGSKVSSTTS